jgi:hypothetical protein
MIHISLISEKYHPINEPLSQWRCLVKSIIHFITYCVITWISSLILAFSSSKVVNQIPLQRSQGEINLEILAANLKHQIISWDNVGTFCASLSSFLQHMMLSFLTGRVCFDQKSAHLTQCSSDQIYISTVCCHPNSHAHAWRGLFTTCYRFVHHTWFPIFLLHGNM